MTSSSSRLLRIFRILFALLVVPAGSTVAEDNVPDNVVLDFRIFEARSSRPDFQAMENLSFFVDTDGSGVTEQQWLATVARKIPDSFLTTLARETVEVDGTAARFELTRRARSFGLRLDLENFLAQGTFEARAKMDLSRSGEPLREFERPIELRLGQTYVWSGRELEISGSEYLSHFRDFDDADDRAELYQELRDFTIFLVVAATPRLSRPDDAVPPIPVTLKPELVPQLESPFLVEIAGRVVLELVLDSQGTPSAVSIVRSSVPELNPRILGLAPSWSFPEAAGGKARLELDLEAKPR